MSFQAVTWAISQDVPKSTEKFILVILASYASEDGFCFPSIERLSIDTSQNRKTIITALKQLVHSGLIEDTGKRVGKTHRVIVYKLVCKQSLKRNGSENGIVPFLDGKQSLKRDSDPIREQSDIPPTPKSAIRTPIMLRLDKLFGRRATTRWDKKEIATLKTLEPIHEDDLQSVERYYSAKHPSTADYRRRDLKTLLNNWNGEVDRARQFKPNSGY